MREPGPNTDNADKWGINEDVTGQPTDKPETEPPEPAYIDSGERAKINPEFLANEPLPNTSYVYSVPVMGEWDNNNLQRMLTALFSQRNEANEAMEIQLVVNTGPAIDELMIWDYLQGTYKKDQQGLPILKQAQTEIEQKHHELLKESERSLDFIKTLVEIQKLTRQNQTDHADGLIDGINDPSLKDIARLAKQKAHTISLAAIDLTKTTQKIIDLPYQRQAISSTPFDFLRTLGADYALTRFGDDTVMRLYDADTIPASNSEVTEQQKIFKEHPEVMYLFIPMTYSPGRHTREFVATSPQQNIKFTRQSTGPLKGSPQIAFRLKAYRELQEIAGWNGFRLMNYEDRDTALRLMYHFGTVTGKVQDGLKFLNQHAILSATYTGDRLDGSVDSKGREASFLLKPEFAFAEDIGHAFSLADELQEDLERLKPQERAKALEVLSTARDSFLRESRKLQRLNRVVLRAFITATEEGIIFFRDEQIQIDQDRFESLLGKKALRLFIQANPKLVAEVLGSSDDFETIKYFLGLRADLPVTELTPFQSALREYIAPVDSLTDLMEHKNISRPEKLAKPNGFNHYSNTDLRSADTKKALLPGVIAEILAVGYVYNMYFLEKRAIEPQIGESPDANYDSYWPTDPKEFTARLPKHFPPIDERVRAMKIATGSKQQPWYNTLPRLLSYPFTFLWDRFSG